MKLDKYGSFDNKKHEEMVWRPKNEEMVLSPYGEFPYELLNKQVCKYLFSTHHSGDTGDPGIPGGPGPKGFRGFTVSGL